MLCSLRVSLVAAILICVASASAMAAKVPQPGVMIYQPASSSFRAAIAGEVVQVTGTNFMLGESFSDFRNLYTVVFLDTSPLDYPLDTRVESRSTLYFTIPVETPCGEQHFYLKNGKNLSDNDAPPSAIYPLYVECDSSGVGPLAVRPRIESVSADSARPGDEIAIYGNDFAFNYAVKFDDNLLPGVHWISKNEIRFQVPQSTSCTGTHTLRIQNRVQHFPSLGSHLPSESNTITFMLSCSGEGGSIEPPRGGDPTGLMALDKNGDCRLNDSEFFASVDQWIATRITDRLFFGAVDGWIGQGSICKSSSSQVAHAKRVEVQSLHVNGGLRFSWPQSLKNLTLEIFSSDGSLVFAESTTDSKMLWNLRDISGKPVPNGVYLLRVTGRDSSGQNYFSKLRKLVVLR